MQNLTPKQRFQESSDNIKKHRAFVDSPEYRRAIDFARLEYARVLAGKVTDQTMAMVAGIKNQAVEEFCIELFWLSEVPQVLKPTVLPSALPEDNPKRN